VTRSSNALVGRLTLPVPICLPLWTPLDALRNQRKPVAGGLAAHSVGWV